MDETEDETEDGYIKWVLSMQASKIWLDGAKTIEPAKRDDKDFQEYLEYDISQIQKEIDKLELLKERLLEEKV